MDNRFDLEKKRREYSAKVVDITKLDPVVSIVLKGEEYLLEFDNRAVKYVLDDTGYNLLKDTFSKEVMVDPKIMGSLLFRGLQHNHPELTADSVDSMFTMRHYPYILDRLIEAIDMFMPEGDDANSGEQDPTLRSGATTTG